MDRSLRMILIALAVSAIIASVVAVPASVVTNNRSRFEHLKGYCGAIPPISSAEFTQRQENMRNLLQQQRAVAFVSEPGATLKYFTNATWKLSERPFLIVIPADKNFPVSFVTPSFEEGKARKMLGPDAIIHTWEEDESPYIAVKKVISSFASSGLVYVEFETRFFIIDGLTKNLAPEYNVQNGFELVRELRMVKSSAEIAILDCAERATKASISAVAGYVTLGMTEPELSPIMHEALQAAGLTNTWTLILFGPNAAYPHGSGSSHPLVDGDLVLIDTGGELYGYQSDCSRTFAVGKITQKGRDIWNIVKASQEAVMKVGRPGITFADIDKAARDVVDAAGYGYNYDFFLHRLGHGIGLQGHEEPYAVRGNNDTVLVEGMTFSVEPGIYIEGELGVRLEEVVVVGRDGLILFGPLSPSIEDPFGGHN
eukprot:TRINITY_DN14430_c0_g1_i1.p1 TRINITY_DN14430_c0_g1~~TRINITY_DN14430_c0_g1_i1.p1  ORF type:complete len:427 (+),score=92.48 TRINITY_DN14430_c0_g1_i1:51-1331(+)